MKVHTAYVQHNERRQLFILLINDTGVRRFLHLGLLLVEAAIANGRGENELKPAVVSCFFIFSASCAFRITNRRFSTLCRPILALI